MKSTKWIMADDDGKGLHAPVPHSGGEGKQLGGYDARNRSTAPRKERAGSHVPAMKESKANPHEYFKKNPDTKMGEPVAVRKWTKKGYL
jgi:hypothetical protein